MVGLYLVYVLGFGKSLQKHQSCDSKVRACSYKVSAEVLTSWRGEQRMEVEFNRVVNDPINHIYVIILQPQWSFLFDKSAGRLGG